MMCGKCDICGKYFDFESGKNVQQIELEDFNIISRYSQTTYKYDICPDCLAAFESFVESRKKPFV